MKNKKIIGALALFAILLLVFLLIGWVLFFQQPETKEKDLSIKPEVDEVIPEGDLEIQSVLISKNVTVHSQPLKVQIQISNNSGHRIQRLMINVFVNDELYKRHYINEGLNQNSNMNYELNDLVFREDQIGFNQVKFEIVPLQEFVDTQPENNVETVSIDVFTY